MLSLSSQVNINSPVRHIRGKVEAYRASTLLETYNYDDNLIEFTWERIPEEGKFFGYGVASKLNVKVRDKDRALQVKAGDALRIFLDSEEGDSYAFNTRQYFYVSQVRRDEETNTLTLYAYDKLKEAGEHYISEIDYSNLTTYGAFINAICAVLGVDGQIPYSLTNKPITANIEGNETLREILDDIAESSFTIYYINQYNNVRFIPLAVDGYVAELSNDRYTALTSGDNRRLQSICHTTQLGDSYIASTSQIGTTQYIRDNVFWTNNPEVSKEVDSGLAYYGNMTIAQFEAVWRGDYRLEVGDRIRIINKDGSYSYSYLLDDKLVYNGALQQTTKWEYDDKTENEVKSNSISEVIKQTYAQVDKANKQIDIFASDIESTKQEIASLQLTTDQITASVSNVSDSTNAAVDTLNQNMAKLTEQVSAAITPEEVAIQVQKQIDSGVNKITTSTGFTFNENGLKVSKSGTDINTQITEDGMKIYRNEEVMLTANNVGVDAYNLHATTYLIVGQHSRFEDYGDRTGCFWIGDYIVG